MAMNKQEQDRQIEANEFARCLLIPREFITKDVKIWMDRDYGLTFGTISALYGLSHGIVTQEQYSFLVAIVIASAVIPTMIASFAFLPKHLLSAVAPRKRMDQAASEGGIDEE